MTDLAWLDRVRFGETGLVPVVAQDAASGAVLMVAWASREALVRTASTAQAHYFSRSRQTLWRKGETSGHVQSVREIRLDCDADTVLYRVDQVGAACHTGTPTCFAELVTSFPGATRTGPGPEHPLDDLAEVVAQRAADRPEGSYTVRLLDRGLAKVSQKVGEEAVEVVIAAHAEDDARLASEAADLLYHLVVLLQARGVPLEDVYGALRQRSK